MREEAAPRLSPAILLMLPSLLLFSIFFFYPLFLLLLKSFEAGLRELLTLRLSPVHYLHFLLDSFYLKVLLRSLLLSALCSAVTLLMGFPLAFVMVRTKNYFLKKLLSLAVISPFFINLLLLAYGWMILLANQGFINKSMIAAGMLSEPLRMMFNFTGIVIGLSHVLLPYMTISLTSILKTLDRSLEEAARTLGAGSVQVFIRIILPHCKRGIMGGAVLVFILAMGAFLVPRLLGSPSNQVLATLILEQAIYTVKWSFAAAMGFILFAITIPLIMIFNRVSR